MVGSIGTSAINTHPHSEVYCRYFRRLFFGNSLTFAHISPCFHAKPPDFPRLIGLSESEHMSNLIVVHKEL